MPSESFNKPIGKWITEQESGEEIVNTFDPKTGKVSTKVEKVVRDVNVIYERSQFESQMCREFEHIFYVYDSHAYLIRCKKCPLHKRIMPGMEYIDKDGHVRSRGTDTLIA